MAKRRNETIAPQGVTNHTDAIPVALEILHRYGVSNRQIEREFFIGRRTLGRIGRGHTLRKNRVFVLTMLIVALKRELEHAQAAADMSRVKAITNDLCRLLFICNGVE